MTKRTQYQRIAPRPVGPQATVNDILNRFTRGYKPERPFIPPPEAHVKPVTEQVYGELAALGRPATVTEIVDRLNADPRRVSEAVRRLAKRGEIHSKRKFEGKSKPLLYFVETLR